MTLWYLISISHPGKLSPKAPNLRTGGGIFNLNVFSTQHRFKPSQCSLAINAHVGGMRRALSKILENGGHLQSFPPKKLPRRPEGKTEPNILQFWKPYNLKTDRDEKFQQTTSKNGVGKLICDVYIPFCQAPSGRLTLSRFHCRFFILTEKR